MYLDCANLQMVKEMCPLFVSFDILPKRAEILKETLLIEQICHWGGHSLCITLYSAVEVQCNEQVMFWLLQTNPYQDFIQSL